ncbi:LPS-assembly protein [Neisseria shayeganii 871]|uniref:LPS-assembly protein n=1 Tax=Neisseria shayeganii 871 TaxID=1032488 RepID=G4CFX1_9NEIS|nr:LPS-assembly protein [Neisseria shayeganii 871]
MQESRLPEIGFQVAWILAHASRTHLDAVQDVGLSEQGHYNTAVKQSYQNLCNILDHL